MHLTILYIFHNYLYLYVDEKLFEKTFLESERVKNDVEMAKMSKCQ